jgi:protein-disulfide isomerase
MTSSMHIKFYQYEMDLLCKKLALFNSVDNRFYSSLTLFKFLVCSIFLVMLTWPVSSRADTPDLEQKVLQIIRNHPEILIQSIQTYQREKAGKQQQERQAFLERMKTNPQSVIGQSPIKGSPQSKIILIEFSDFQCPYCAQAQEPIRQFIEKHENDVALIYKNIPLTALHPNAMSAAKAAWAAGQQGKFWQYHDALFSHQDKLGEALYLSIAQELGIDINQFNHDRHSSSADAFIKKDTDLAESMGIPGTPFIIMNGEVLNGQVQAASLDKLLEKILSTATP